MRNFIISAICLGLLVGIWGVFDLYSGNRIDECRARLSEDVIKAAQAGRWKRAERSFSQFSDDWKQYRKAAAFFLDTQDLNEIDYTIEKTAYYIKASDLSNASGELANLEDQLFYLHYNETPAAENIF